MLSHLFSLAAALLLIGAGVDAQAGRLTQVDEFSIDAKSSESSTQRTRRLRRAERRAELWAERREERRAERMRKGDWGYTPRDGEGDERPNTAVPEPAAGLLFPLGALVVSRSLGRR